jgi:tetratricopeptide (TPR) repeat protein
MTWYTLLLALALSASAPARAPAAESREDSLLTAKKHFSFAVQHKKNGEYEDALAQYEKSIAYNDTVYQVHFSFAELLMLMGKTERAKIEYLTTFALNPRHSASATVLAGMYYRAADYDSALVMCEAVYRVAPSDTTLAGIVKLREYLGRETEALNGLETLIEHGDRSRDTLVRASRLAVKTGDFHTADRFSSLLLRERPDDVEALRIAFQASLALKDTGRAAGYLERFADADSADASALTNLASLYRSRGERRGLIRTLTRMTTLDPRNTGLIGELAEVLAAEGDTMHAEDTARKGLAISPKDGKFRILMGELYRSKGRNDRALAEYRIALSDPLWEAIARQLIARLERPETDAERKEKEFFGRGK